MGRVGDRVAVDPGTTAGYPVPSPVLGEPGRQRRSSTVAAVGIAEVLRCRSRT